MVYFSSGPMDLELPTIELHEPRANWTILDIRQGAFNYLIFRWLASMFPRARGFLHTDDDSYPVMPNIRRKLDDFMCRNGGAFPYASTLPAGRGGPHQSGICKPHYKEQTDLVRKKCRKDLPYAQGNILHFSQRLLREMVAVANIDTCPPTAPGDQAIGMLWQCMGGLKEKRLDQYLTWPIEYWYVFGDGAKRPANPYNLNPFSNETSIKQWLSVDVYHNAKLPEQLQLLDSTFRSAFFLANMSWP